MKGASAILIPAYNEEKNIGDIVEGSLKFSPYVIVVDDGSKDRTSEVARKYRAIVLRHEKNGGKGEALRTGFNHVLKNMKSVKGVIIIDADNQYPASEIPAIMKPLETDEADVVMGARDWDRVPLRHRLGNFVWRFFFNLLFGTSLKDTNCGLIGLSRRALDVMGSSYGGYIIENFILAKAVENKLRIMNVPVNVRYNRVSGIVRGSRMVLGNFVFIVREGIKYRLGRK